MIVISLLIVILTLTLAFLVYKKSQYNYSKKIFLWFSVILSLWIIFNQISLTQIENDNLIIFIRVVMFLAVFLSLFFYLLLRSVTNKKTIENKKKYVLIVISILVGALTLTKYLFSDIIVKDGKAETVADFGAYIFGLYVMWMIFGGMYILFKRYRISKGLEKQQLSYFGVGISVTLFLMFFFNFVIVIIFDNTSFIQFSSLFVLPFILTASYALIKYRLLDINIIIRKSLIQIVTFAILFGLYAYILIFAQRASVDSINLGDNTALLLAILIIAITIEPLRKLIYKWIDNLFDSKERDRKELLQRMKVLTASSIQFESLKKKTIDELSKILGSKVEFYIFNKERDSFNDTSVLNSVVLIIKKGEILIKDEFQHNEDKNLEDTLDFMNKKNISGMIPIGKADELLGVFIVNDSDTSSVYTKDRIEFMNNFASQVEFAFASSLAYKHAIERIKI